VIVDIRFNKIGNNINHLEIDAVFPAVVHIDLNFVWRACIVTLISIKFLLLKNGGEKGRSCTRAKIHRFEPKKPVYVHSPIGILSP